MAAAVQYHIHVKLFELHKWLPAENSLEKEVIIYSQGILTSQRQIRVAIEARVQSLLPFLSSHNRYIRGNTIFPPGNSNII
jgi:hypothetical protein